MALTLYRASAPGTLMILGEHAVLNNKPALVSAIDQRISVLLKPRTDQKINISSSLGYLETDLQNCEIKDPFQFVLSAILVFKPKLLRGFELTIVSDFAKDVGLGSSAAVTVATLAVLDQYSQSFRETRAIREIREVREAREHWEVREMELTENRKSVLFKMARTAILRVQGVGSGADAAASVYGGLILYQQNDPFVLKQFSQLIPLVAVYSGFKTPTKEVIQKVQEKAKITPKILDKIFESMAECVHEAVDLIEKEQWHLLGNILNIHNGLMNALGLNTAIIDKIVEQLREDPSIYGAKISGSGLGDCVIGVLEKETLQSLEMPNLPESAKRVLLQTSLDGVCYE